jgi:hypothetical protein
MDNRGRFTDVLHNKCSQLDVGDKFELFGEYKKLFVYIFCPI